MRRLVCWLLGHRWRIRRKNLPKHLALSHLHPAAGFDSDCMRCGKQWRDAGGWV